MKQLNFKQKFPELNDKQREWLERELLELIGPDITSDKHITRDYNLSDQIRDEVNSHKKALRSRLQTYINGKEAIDHNEKSTTN